MQRIDCGEPPDPWAAGRRLQEAPEIHPEAWVRASDFGRHTYLGPRSSVVHSELGDWGYAMGDNQIAHARIGKFCNIATAVRINPSNHPWWRATLHHVTYRSASYGFAMDDDSGFFDWRARDRVVIGPDVWIGHGAIVMPGVRIGAGAAIGSGSVVTHDVPDYAIVVGVPARVLRMRCDARTARRMLDLAWWDWDDARLAAVLGDLRALDIEAFAAKYAP